MSADARYEIRDYVPGDEAQILDLFRRSFHNERPFAHWRWKFRDNPWGGQRICLAFDTDRTLVGQYTGYPVPFWIDGREVLAHQVGDTMTAPSVRAVGRGPTSILGRMAFRFYDKWCGGPIAFNYGFNAGNIQRFSDRFLGSERVEDITYRVRDLQSNPIPVISRWERIARGGYQLELVERPGEEFDRFFARVRSDYGFLVRRDRQYLQWRYFDCPDTRYFMVAIRQWRHLVGWIVFRIRGDRFTIGDVLFDRRQIGALEVLLRHVVPSYPVRIAETWLSKRPEWLERAFERMGFASATEPDNLALMAVPFSMPDVAERMRGGLYYTWGDSDLF